MTFLIADEISPASGAGGRPFTYTGFMRNSLIAFSGIKVSSDPCPCVVASMVDEILF
jgi:hypothetical protein